MNKMDLYRAFGAVDDDILERSEKAAVIHTLRRRMSLSAASIIAIIITASLILTVSAAVFFGWHTRLLDYLNIPPSGAEKFQQAVTVIEQSQTYENATVTVKQAFGDAHTAYIVAELKLPDGVPLDGKFKSISIDVDAQGSYNYECVERNEDTRTLTYIINVKTSDKITGKKIGLTFRDYYHAPTHQELIDASWEFSFRLKFKDYSRNSTINEMVGDFTIRSVTITPVSVIIYIDDLPADARYVDDFDIIMQDGSIPEIIKYQNVGTFDSNKTTAIYGMFPEIIDPMNVKSVSVNGTVFDIE